ncbi:DUF4214 domain-containing protein [Poseidonibacter lekithochrous]|uniref:DUF4214 domain-containing protein n=1 Tax=Poseidonibacter TaxID=2321187 RepID=UPI001C08080A|nr:MULTISPECIES: DUF4214 domain-containing protein [Poseidonibacter]MBU3014244.1 DUF4214 domain-containing protein [Poseidonibacter lekithochrous]MDO6827541.1 DUF4214 domain-containing protein [Poseidonibacter sp. 1_MG-2023]
MAFNTNQAIVAEYYVAALGRLPDQAGFEYWTSQLDAGMTPDALMGLFLDRSFPEVATRYPETQTNGEFIASVYSSTFGREADAEGLTYWTAQLDTKTQTQVLAEMLAVAKDPANTVDAAYLAAQKALAEDALDTTVVTPEVPGVVGSTFELTGSTDKLVGTDDNDTFEAGLVQSELTGAVANALSTADKIDGGAGTDTLNAELVRQFSFNGDVSEVSPKTTSVEIVEFNAQDTTSNGIANTITVDAEKMTGVEKIGSYYSDGDLVIENLNTLTDAGTIRNTSDMTITMNHTDNFNSDEDASDLTVYFDEDYLNNTTSTGNSALTINMINTLNLKLANGSSVIQGFDALTFSVDSTLITVDVNGLELSAVQGAIEAAVTAAGFTDISVSTYTEQAYFGTNIYYEDTGVTYTAGSYAGEYSAFVLTNSGSEILTEGGFTLTDGQKDGSLAYSQDDRDAVETTNPITINVELEKVGQDGEGGNLIIGGKDQNLASDGEEDQNDGIEVFNITVKGNTDQPSDLGYITSTDQALKTVNVTSETGSVASLRVRDAFQGTTANTIDTEGLDTFNANTFMGTNLVIGDVDAAENINTFTATSSTNVTLNEEINGLENGVKYTVATGSGKDEITVDLDGDAVDTIGEGFAVSTGANDDIVTVNMQGSGAANAGVSVETTADLNNLSIATGSGADMVTLIGGTDTAVIDGDADFNITTGADSDMVYINSINDAASADAAKGQWIVGTNTAASVETVYYKAILTVDFAGFEQAIAINTTAANNFVATQVEINEAIINAIEANPELSRLLTTELGTGTQELTIDSVIEGANELNISIAQPNYLTTDILSTDVSALNAGYVQTGVTTSVLSDTAAEISGIIATNATDVATVVGTGTLGGSADETAVTNVSTIDLGAGANDLVVLNSNEASTQTIVFSATWGKVSVVNFETTGDSIAHTVAEAADTNINMLDFTAWLDDEVSPSGSTLSNTAVATTYATATTLGQNTVVAVDFATQIDAIDGSATNTFATLTDAEVLAALNADATFATVVDAATIGTNARDSILLIENTANLGEYKAYNVTYSDNAADDEFASATLVGTIDFGNQVDLVTANLA